MRRAVVSGRGAQGRRAEQEGRAGVEAGPGARRRRRAERRRRAGGARATHVGVGGAPHPPWRPAGQQPRWPNAGTRRTAEDGQLLARIIAHHADLQADRGGLGRERDLGALLVLQAGGLEAQEAAAAEARGRAGRVAAPAAAGDRAAAARPRRRGARRRRRGRRPLPRRQRLSGMRGSAGAAAAQRARARAQSRARGRSRRARRRPPLGSGTSLPRRSGRASRRAGWSG